MGQSPCSGQEDGVTQCLSPLQCLPSAQAIGAPRGSGIRPDQSGLQLDQGNLPRGQLDEGPLSNYKPSHLTLTPFDKPSAEQKVGGQSRAVASCALVPEHTEDAYHTAVVAEPPKDAKLGLPSGRPARKRKAERKIGLNLCGSWKGGGIPDENCADDTPNASNIPCFCPMTPSGLTSYAILVAALVAIMTLGIARDSSAVILYTTVLMVFLVFGDLLYSRFLAHSIFRLSDDEVTPAHYTENVDHPDYSATPAFVLFGHHWTSITGAAPIIGPAIASYYGWLPAMLWVVLGVIFAGGVHDFGVLVVSARNGGRSIGDLAGIVISWRARVLFLMLIMFLCWIVVAVFMNAIANLFMANPETVLPVNAEIPLAAIMGFSTRIARQRLSSQDLKIVILLLSLFFLLILYALVFLGVAIENGNEDDPVFGWALHIGKGENYTIHRQICRDSINFKRDSSGNPLEATCGFGAKQFWTVYLTVYAFVVSIIPVWVVLQPRDFINSHQLKFCMLLMLIGLLVKSPSLDAEAIRTDASEKATDQAPIFPMLFTTIACGSVSGFHGLVSSGVTSKQLDKMRDARPIGYCAMMGESALSALVIIICCSSGYWKEKYSGWPVNWGSAFIPGAAQLLEELGIGADESSAIIIVLVVSFAATTLDSGMRIQRVLIGELGALMQEQVPIVGKVLNNVFVAGVLSAAPACALANSRIVGSLWNLFGATNQLVALLSLVVVAIYVWRYHRFKVSYVIPLVIPICWLGIFITWALGRTIYDYLDPASRPDKVIDWFTTVPSYPSIIIAFAIAVFVFALLFEAFWYFSSRKYLIDAQISWATGKIMDVDKCKHGTQIKCLTCC